MNLYSKKEKIISYFRYKFRGTSLLLVTIIVNNRTLGLFEDKIFLKIFLHFICVPNNVIHTLNNKHRKPILVAFGFDFICCRV